MTEWRRRARALDRLAAVPPERQVERCDGVAAGHVGEYVRGVYVVKRIGEEAFDVRAPELDRLFRDAAHEVLGDHVSDLQRSSGSAIQRLSGVVDGCRSNHVRKPPSVSLLELILGGADLEHDLHSENVTSDGVDGIPVLPRQSGVKRA
jgi:hypothetical protein